jgi:hypothetical protein
MTLNEVTNTNRAHPAAMGLAVLMEFLCERNVSIWYAVKATQAVLYRVNCRNGGGLSSMVTLETTTEIF